MRKVFSFLILTLSLQTSGALGDGLPYQEKKVASDKIEEIAEVGVNEHLGKKLDPTAEFLNEDGEVVRLGDYFGGHKPVLLTLVYYSCPSLCNFHLNGITEVLKQMQWTTGKEFDLVAISFEPKDTPEIAKMKKAAYLKEYGREAGQKGWHFLTDRNGSAKKIADQVGFSYKWESESKQWAHPAVAYILTPDGTVSRYLYGIGFEPKTLRLSLIEASDGKIGNVVDKIILYCFNYNPKDRKYSLVAYNT
ncbi:MAG: SCO family protein, partial [Bdellovibrionales bacterium]|nr:SCO family protein [Bdellovibrionales bacterium]